MDASRKPPGFGRLCKAISIPIVQLGRLAWIQLVCLIPGIDTVMDVRDLIANIIAIVAAPTNGMAWFNLVLTLIGFIPGLGSVAKGIVKIVLSN